MAKRKPKSSRIVLTNGVRVTVPAGVDVKLTISGGVAGGGGSGRVTHAQHATHGARFDSEHAKAGE